MISRLLRSLRFRVRRWRLGASEVAADASVFPVRIGGRAGALACPPAERDVFVHEFGKIFLEDCYGLDSLPRRTATVLDIGANAGLFSLAARHRFSRAQVACYEPNPSLRAILEANVTPFGIRPHFEAVGRADGHVRLNFQENSLHSTTSSDPRGAIPQVSFATAVARLGGSIDLLKLDCEGAEWALFEAAEPWRGVRRLTMEYHLWAKAGARLDDLTAALERLGFVTTHVAPSEDGSFGMLRAARRNVV